LALAEAMSAEVRDGECSAAPAGDVLVAGCRCIHGRVDTRPRIGRWHTSTLSSRCCGPRQAPWRHIRSRTRSAIAQRPVLPAIRAKPRSPPGCTPSRARTTVPASIGWRKRLADMARPVGSAM